jgi:hypothetical protein
LIQNDVAKQLGLVFVPISIVKAWGGAIRSTVYSIGIMLQKRAQQADDPDGDQEVLRFHNIMIQKANEEQGTGLPDSDLGSDGPPSYFEGALNVQNSFSSSSTIRTGQGEL